VNDQRSTLDQVKDLVVLATEHGLYDAADWIKATWPERAQERPASSSDDLIRRLADELERMNERHGCGQIECSIAMNAVADARKVLGMRRKEPFDGSGPKAGQ
jgi:hypothetical protein